VGEVVECRRLQFRSSGGVGSIAFNKYKVIDHVPVAISAEGVEGLGTHRLGKDWCERQVGNTVDLIVHPDDVTRSKVSSYIQLWLLPVHVFVTVFLIFLSVVKPKLWNYVVPSYFVLVFLFLTIELYF